MGEERSDGSCSNDCDLRLEVAIISTEKQNAYKSGASVIHFE